MSQRQDDFLKEITETLAATGKAIDLQAQIDSLPFYAIFERKWLQDELKKHHLEQANKAKESLTKMGKSMSEMMKMFEDEEEVSQEDIDKWKQIISGLNDRQRELALLKIAEGLSLEEALEAGQNFKTD